MIMTNRITYEALRNEVGDHDSKHCPVELTVWQNADFYHSVWCLKLLHNNRSLADKISDIFHTKKILWIVFLVTLINGSLTAIWNICFWGRLTHTCPLWNDFLLYGINYLIGIIFILSLCTGLCSFNIKLFVKEMTQFETLYKVYNGIVVFVCLSTFRCDGTNTVGSWIPLIFSLIMLAVCVAAIDAWPVPYYAKLIVVILTNGVIVYGYISRCYLVGENEAYECYFTFTVPFIKGEVNGFYLLGNAFENLIIFFLKQAFSLMYYEMNCNNCPCNRSSNLLLNGCKCNSCGKYPNLTVGITHKPMIIWLDSFKHRIATNSIRGYNLSSKSNSRKGTMSASSTSNISNNGRGSIDHFSQSKSEETDLFSVDEQTSADIGICRIVARTGNDFYHTKWLLILCTCCGNYNKQNVDRLSKIFQTRRVLIPSIVALLSYFVVSIIQLGINDGDISALIHSTTVESLTFSFIRSLVLLTVVIPVLFSFNIKLVKQQLLEFETMYKIANVIIICLCEISYVVKQVNDNAADTAIYDTAAYQASATIAMINLMILVIGVSCIDAWPMYYVTKVFVLCISCLCVLFYYMTTVNNRSIDDYYTIKYIKIASGAEWDVTINFSVYSWQTFAFRTLFVFLVKNTWLMVYKNYSASERGSCLNRCLFCGRNKRNLYPNMAVGISHGYIINWKNAQMINAGSQELGIGLMQMNSH